MTTDTIDPIDVMRNPQDYLLDGSPINTVYVLAVGEFSSCDAYSKRWSTAITRKPKKRKVKCRAWEDAGGRTLVSVGGYSQYSLDAPDIRWLGPVFEIEVPSHDR